MEQLKPEHIRTVLDTTFTRLVEALERTKEPWMRTQESSEIPGMYPTHNGFNTEELEHYDRNRAKRNIRLAVKHRDPSRWQPIAAQQLRSLGIEPDQENQLFQDLCVELGKLELMYLDAEEARSNGDFSTEETFVEYYKRNGYQIIPSDSSQVGTGPRLSEAWTEYYEEKTSGRPKADWNPKTALGRQATFDEFLELVTDIRVNQVSRATLQSYLQQAQRLPKNRKKIYGDTPATELLQRDFDNSDLPSARTNSEKLIQIGSFLRWCRISKGYIEHDPSDGLSVRTTKNSYAPFTKSDLENLFLSKEYTESKHRKSWHFWVPLIALYTGARQTEIGQLLTENVLQEDGVWIFTITDTGIDQRVKTEAGRRKVPVSSMLIEIGLLEYVEYLQAKNVQRLFPDLPKGNQGWGQKISRWFNDTYKKNCAVVADPTGGRKVFHSFRHSAITMAMSNAVPIQHCQQVFGHEKSVMGETATYTSQFPVDTLVQVIEALDYGIDHSAYNETWRDYSP